MIRLKVLGGAVLERDGTPLKGRAAQPRHLAVLAFLAACPRERATRDKLIAYLWPNHAVRRARHRLSVAIHVLRRGLGPDSLTTSSDAVALNPDVIETDLRAFTGAFGEGRLEDAVALYSGPFLDGFFVNGAPELERWVEARRAHVSGLYRGALERLIAEAGEVGDPGAATEWWRRWSALDPYSTPVAVGLMRAMVAAGNIPGALRHARAHAAIVERELGIPADSEVLGLAAELVAEAGESGGVIPGVERRALLAAAPSREAEPDGPGRPTSTEAALPTDGGARTPERRWASPSRLALVTASGLMLVGYAAWRLGPERVRAEAAEGPSVAVLPFAVLNDGPGDGRLGESLAEDVRSTLRMVPGLRVRAGASSSSGAGTALGAEQPLEGPQDLRTLGRSLGVASVVDGTVSRDEEGIRVMARLLDVASGEVRWTERYDRPAQDENELCDELSLTIADALRLRVAPYEPKEYTGDQSAYDRFLQGVYAHRRFTNQDLWTALQFYREAYEKDPSFALAHAIAGNAFIDLTILGLSPRVGLERARAQVLTALALDSTLAEGHAALGYIQIWGDRDFEAGERSLRRAIMLYPTLPQARNWYGFYALYVRGWHEAGVSSVRRSLEVDPLNTARSRAVEWALYQAGRYDEVQEQARMTVSIDAGVARSLRGTPLGESYRELGLYGDAIAEFEGAYPGPAGLPSAGLAVTYARMGRAGEARAILQELESRAEDPGGSTLDVARIYANLGEADRAFQWLDRTLEARPNQMLVIRVDPTLDPLRSDPRFERLARRLGFPVQQDD